MSDEYEVGKMKENSGSGISLLLPINTKKAPDLNTPSDGSYAIELYRFFQDAKSSGSIRSGMGSTRFLRTIG